MFEPADVKLLFDDILEDEVIFTFGDILSDEPTWESDLHRD
ncbi:hypothetical protein [Nostoc sp. NZL]